MKKDPLLPANIEANVARLIPVGAMSQFERRATSSLLATFMGVPEYAQHMFGMLDSKACKLNTRSEIKCYTEIAFKNEDEKRLKKNKSDRPDGLIVIKNGKKTWTAFIEAKIKNNKLDAEQVERYLDLARNNNIDAVITISNEYANLPSHHPVKVSGHKTKSVELHHWSWHSILTEAAMHTDDCKDEKDVDDITKRFILNEFVRFLDHDSTGVMDAMTMSKGWSAIFTEGGLDRKTDDVESAVGSWHNLTRELSLRLSREIMVDAVQFVPNKYKNNKNGYAEKLKDDVNDLIGPVGVLSARYNVRDAASPMYIDVNVREKYIAFTAKLKPSNDVKTAQGAIGWFIRELKKIKLKNISEDSVWVKACYAGKNTDRSKPIKEVNQKGYVAINESNKSIPHTLEVYVKLDLKQSEMKGVSKFPEIIRSNAEWFYSEILENLQKAQNKAPSMSKRDIANDEEDEDSLAAE
ncbi:MAG: hypothetical protein NZ828_11945 [Alphaproteobacteria bacterium]|nr:hypothetical protein [Alphaproteobacteria bacterium]